MEILKSFWMSNDVWVISTVITIIVLCVLWYFKSKNSESFEQNKTIAMQIVKLVEQAIPDETQNKKLEIVDNVLKKLVTYSSQDNNTLNKDSMVGVISDIVAKEVSATKKNS